jgi:hypothetical protein
MHVHATGTLGSRRSYAVLAARSDVAVAVLAALIAGGVYVATMFPGLAAIGDTPKFQFVGAVLGTPHSPGYPLYMMLSWLFAQLPIGTIAYRMNLMSAVFGALAVAFLCGVALELGCRRWIALTAALNIGWGRVFWSQALLAEVYTLNAALFAGALLFLLRWSRTRRDRDLIAAVAFVAGGAAHHLTLVMTIPVLSVYALSVDARLALSRRVILWTIALAGGSVATYGSVWLRTSQGASFLEVQAQSWRDLVTIMRADAFDQFLGALSARDIVRERVPLIAGWLGGELRIVGVASAVAGVAALGAARWREGLLLAGIAAVIIGFALDYVVYDVEVFLLLAMIALGLIGAVGIERGISAVDRWMKSSLLRSLVAAAVVMLVPFGQFRANRAANDQHRHGYENALLDALFRELPDKSAIVRENYPLDHMLLYKLLAEQAAGTRTIVLIPPDVASVDRYLRDGYSVYAFHDHRQDLHAAGVEFADAPLRLPTAPSLAHLLDTEAMTMGYPLGQAIGIGPAPDAELSGEMPFSPAIRPRR